MDTTVQAGTTYFSRLQASNSYGTSAYANTASATPLATTSAPAAATDLQATAVSATRINLSWTDNANSESGFQILRASSPTDPFLVIATTGANITTYTDKTVTSGMTWHYRVRTINPSGTAPLSNKARATTP